MLPVYSSALAESQQELLRINNYSTKEVLYDVDVILRHQAKDYVEQKVLICSEQCYCLRQINETPSTVINRIPFRSFKSIFIDGKDPEKQLVYLTVTFITSRRRPMPSFRLVCDSEETAKQLCEKVMQAKKLYDQTKKAKTQLKVSYI